MASSSSIKAGKAWIEISADNSPLLAALRAGDKALTEFGTKVAKIGAGMAGIGLAIGGALAGAVLVFENMGSELLEASQRTGIAVEALSALKFAAGQSGVGFETLLTAVGKMQKTISGVADEAEGTTGKLDALGISVADLAGLSPDEQFLKVAEAISAIQDPASRTTAVMNIFGRSGAQLLPLFSQGAKGVKALTEQAKAMGIVMSTEDATAADVFGDSLGLVFAQVKAVTASIGAAIAGALQPYAATVGRIGANIIKFVNEHRGMVVAVGLLAAGLVTAGAAVSAFSFAIVGAGATLGLVGTAVGVLLSPLGLLAAGLLAAGGAFVYFSGLGKNAGAILGEAFQGTLGMVSKTVAGIGNALKSGNLALAAEIATTGIKLVWEELKNFLIGIWEGLQTSLVIAWTNGIAKVKSLWADFKSWYTNLINNIGDTVVEVKIGVELNKAQAELDAAKATGDKAAIAAAQKQVDLKRQELEYVQEMRETDRRANDSVLKAEQARITAERDAAIEQAKKESGTADATRQNELAQKVKDLTAKLAELTNQAALEVKIDAALEDFFTGVGGTTPDTAQTPSLIANAAAIGESIAKAAQSSSRGLFNIGGIQGLQSGGTDYARKTAEAAEKTARNTDTIARAVRTTPGLVFA